MEYVVSVTKITEECGDEIQLKKELRVVMKSTTSIKKIIKEALEKGELEDNPYAD